MTCAKIHTAGNLNTTMAAGGTHKLSTTAVDAKLLLYAWHGVFFPPPHVATTALGSVTFGCELEYAVSEGWCEFLSIVR